MFMNPKDAPFAVAMALLLLGLLRAFQEYPRPSAATLVLTGIGIGTAFGTRILAGIAVAYGLGALAVVATADVRALGWRAGLQRVRTFVLRMVPGVLSGYLIMAVLWPWSVRSPLNPLYAAEYFDTFFERPWAELYEGRQILVPDMPASYLLHLLALKLPEIMLLLGSIGAVGALAGLVRSEHSPQRRAVLLIVLLGAFLPIAVAMATRPALYNGVRHFIFVLPPFAVLGGLAVTWLVERATHYGRIAVASLAVVFAAGVIAPVLAMAQLHPYEYAYFNALAGGERGASGRYMLDYWGLAFKQASEDLRARLEAAHDAPPAGRRWVVAICGPQASAKVELGPQFETTFDQKKADFVITLGTFYCRDLQAPIIVEVARDGVNFARVYDLRGRAAPKLLTVPPP
jgi:hypothetical protein